MFYTGFGHSSTLGATGLLMPRQVYMTKMMIRILQGLLLLSLAGCSAGEAVVKQASYHYQMGLSFLGEKNTTRALIEFAEAEKLTPDDPELLNQLGLAYFYKKKYDLAEEKYLRAIKLRAHFPEARNNIGVNYLEMKRWDDAIAQLKIVTEDIFFPNQENAVINLGLAYLGKKDYRNASRIFLGAVNANPQNPLARMNLGRVYLAMGKSEAAVAELKDALGIYRDYAMAHYYLGIAYQTMKDIQAARASFNEVIRIAPYTEMSQLATERLDQLK